MDDLPYIYTVFDTGTLDEFKSAVNQPLVTSLSCLFFSLAQMFVGLRKQFIHKFVFPTWACSAGFNNNSNIPNS